VYVSAKESMVDNFSGAWVGGLALFPVGSSPLLNNLLSYSLSWSGGDVGSGRNFLSYATGIA
jgi:hypothetical protein